MAYYIPSNLNIDDLLIEYPMTIYRFKKEKLLYLLDLITTIPASNRASTTRNNYVSIKASILQNKIRNYKAYINYLICVGVIETDNQYIAGNKSKGYRITKKYAGIVVEYLPDGAPKKFTRIKNTENLSFDQVESHQHLIKWYDEGLKIDKEAALDFIKSDYEMKINNPELQDWDASGKTHKNPVNQYNNSLVSIEKIATSRFFLNIDDTGYRLHSPLTILRSELRNFLTYNSAHLVSIDINNSQPYLATLLFNPSFWDKTHVLTVNTLGLDYSSVFSSYSIYSSFIMLCNNAKSCIDSDLHTYINKVKEGVFYEYISECLKDNARDRKILKAAVFQMLFTDNRFIGQEAAKPKRIFRQVFPNVYQLFRELKRKNKVSLPKLLQRIESYVILQVVTKRIATEYPMLPIFTIHDSIVTVQGKEEYVKQIMEEEMKKIFRFPPKLSTSYWLPENINYIAELQLKTA